MAGIAYLRGQGAQDSLLLPFLGQAGFAPAVAGFDGGQRLNKDGGPAVGNVVDDAGGLGLELGLNQQHQAAVALGDNRFLHHGAALVAAQAALHYLVKLLVGGAGFPAQLTQVGAGVVQHFPRRADGGADGLLQSAQVGQVLGQAGQQGQVFPAVKVAPVVGGGPGQFLDFVEFLTPQGAAQHGPLHVLPQVNAGAKLQPAAGTAGIQKQAGLGGLLLAVGDFQGIGDGRQVLGALPAQHGAGIAGQPLAYLVKLQQAQGLGKAAQRVGSR